MSAREATRAFITRIPWWGSALLGVAVVVALTIPLGAGFGQAGGRHYGWYTTHDGRLLTGLILDQVQYTRLVDATAGRAPSSEIAPFTSRALAPWLAGRLPLDPATSLTVVNLVLLGLGTFALALLAMDLTRRRGPTFVAVMVWAFSFPVLRYTGVAFVDPATVGLVPVALLLLWRRWLVPALGVFAAAIWMKETALVLLPIALAFVWARPGDSRTRRVVTGGLWLVTAAAAYLTAGLLGGDHLIVFASWIPESLAVAWRMFLLNALTPSRLVAFGLTVLPAVFGVAMWWRYRRRGAPILADHDATPLVVGCLAGALLGLVALPTALFDGRTAWTTLAPAALLVAAWAGGRDRRTASADIRSFARAATVPTGVLAVSWLLFAAVVPMPVGTDALGSSYQPRFAGVPTEPEELTELPLRDRGGTEVEVPGSGPALVEFDSDSPITLRSGGIDLIEPDRSTRGVALFDPRRDRKLEIEAEGPWEALIRPVSSALFWESISPLSGHGPNVVVFPGGLAYPIDVTWTSSDPADRIELVGGCHLGHCGELGREDVIPPGTEALVVDAAGDWTMIPGYDADHSETPPLDGTVIDGQGESTPG